MYQPYFYIIQHIETGLYYAGAKWSCDADPSTFLTESGYQTSSKLVKQIIRSHGIGKFIIRKIRLFDTSTEVQRYEKRFLEKVDAANNSNFYNMHNGNSMIFGTYEFYKRMIEKYGVECSMKYEPSRQKQLQTVREKYGVDHYSQTVECQQKVMQTNRDKLDVDYPMQSILCIEKARQTYQERYGVNHYSQTREFKEEYRKTSNKHFGTDHPMQNEQVKQHQKYTTYMRHEVNNPFQLSYVQERSNASMREKYGVDKYFQTNKMRRLNSHYAKERNKYRCECEYCGKICNWGNYNRHHGKYCKENPNRESKTKYTCPHCLKTSENYGNMKRYHYDNCKNPK